MGLCGGKKLRDDVSLSDDSNSKEYDVRIESSVAKPNEEKRKMPPAGKLIHLDTVKNREWNKRIGMDGVFKHGLEEITNKRLGGKYDFICQKLVSRKAKRDTGVSKVASTFKPFNPKGFHFGKVKRDEVLFTFQRNTTETSQSERKKYDWDLLELSGDQDVSDLKEDSNLVIVNVSPIMDKHILLVPQAFQQHPQQMTKDAMCTAVAMAAHSYAQTHRMFFNCLGGGASVNHLHIQAINFDEKSRRLSLSSRTNSFHGPRDSQGCQNGNILAFPIEMCDDEDESLWKFETVECLEMNGYPLQCFKFVAYDVSSEGLRERLSHKIMTLLTILQKHDIAHNIMFSQTRAETALCIYVILRKIGSQVETDMDINLGGLEVCGYFIAMSDETFNFMNDKECEKLLRQFRLDNGLYENVRNEFLRECESPDEMAVAV